ncbi:protein of unknown function DUF4094 [Cynara cardunculus var. scolymus]|uniref:Hexosyltransferase n=1 Tax=Cynara cardunculus var. scolymus TaxID=59895 RepID=A0A103Y4D8_CYNCS|nr:protein of unknown function DUF4094 [Cynara cardunculus var. scolymus]
MAWKNRGDSNSRNLVSRKLSFFLCIGCFLAGMLFTDSSYVGLKIDVIVIEAEKLKLLAEGCDTISKDVRRDSKDITGEVSKTHNAVQTLDKTISNLEMELVAARAMQDSIVTGSPISDDLRLLKPVRKRKYLMVVGINTAFSSRRRRDSLRATWMPQGDKLRKLEEEKGIVMRFVIGHSATSGGILDRAIEAEEKKHGDFLRLEHIEGGVRYHEPEHWKFGEEGNKYFRHATGQLYAISRDLATYISINQSADRIKEVHKRCGEDNNALWSASF